MILDGDALAGQIASDQLAQMCVATSVPRER
jgi:hypothetical protein